MQVPKGRANYEPNSIDDGSVRENPELGYKTFPEAVQGEKTVLRAETFADHYSQARQFYRSMSEPEQRHMVSALAFELGKVSTLPIRTRVLGHLSNIDPALQEQVAVALGMEGKADAIKPAVAPQDLEPSDALSIIKKAPATLKGRKLGVLITDGFDPKLLNALRNAAKTEKAAFALVARKVGGVKDAAGKLTPADFSIAGGPSVIFDAVAILSDEEQAEALARKRRRWTG
jgi:catalase